jgi:tetratricopeptide (TPR) repeat protein
VSAVRSRAGRGADRAPWRCGGPAGRGTRRRAVLAAAVWAALVLGAGACGARSKGETTTGSSGTVTREGTGLMEGTDPSDLAPGAGSGSSGGAGTDDREAGDARGEEAAAGAGKDAAPPIVPPDLDLPPRDQQQRVQAHLANARGALRGAARDPDRALNETRAALEADAGNIDAVVLMAHAYHAKDLDDTAEVVLDMVYKERPAARSNPGLYHVYGLIYDATDRPERAMLAYRKAVELDPNHRSALINLGVHYLSNRMFADAVRVYERLTRELSASSAAIWTNLGSAYRGHAADYPAGSPRRDELLRLADTSYRRALSEDRSYANAYYNLGLLYLDAEPFPGPDGPMDTLKRLERARTYFDEYRGMRGANMDLVGERLKQVDKLMKREATRRKRTKGGDDW